LSEKNETFKERSTVLFANLKFYTGSYEEAKNYYRDLVLGDNMQPPNLPNIYLFNLGRSCFYNEDYADALIQFRRLIQTDKLTHQMKELSQCFHSTILQILINEEKDPKSKSYFLEELQSIPPINATSKEKFIIEMFANGNLFKCLSKLEGKLKI